MKNYLRLAALLTALLPVIGDGRAADQPREPTGFYEGTVKSKDASELKVSLNLTRAKDRFEGEMSTPVGNFALKGGTFKADQLHLEFDADGHRGVIEARLGDGSLRGEFRVGDDSGPVELRRVGDAKPIVASVPRLDISKEQWREDLQNLAHELPKRHGNAFHHVSRERFEAAVAELDRRLDRLNGDETYVGLNRIAVLIGDGHTYVDFPPDRASLPLALERFDGEYRIVRVVPGLEKALGARVVKIEDTPIARARELLLTMTPGGETPELAEARVTYFLSLGMLLHGFGITSDRNQAPWTLADDNGKEFTVTVQSLTPDRKVEWVSAYKEPPLYQQRPAETFWYTYLPESGAVYCNFRGYRELGNHARGLLPLIAERRPDKLVIDLRQNGGGDFTEGLKYVIDPIRDLADINKKGRLFVLIGPHTFSAAMSNAAHFRARTAAILVGQTIGERPNSYQEARQMTLPNSRLLVRYSTQYYKFVESGENVIRPDKEIIPSWTEYKAGRDPVLGWVLKYEGKP